MHSFKLKKSAVLLRKKSLAVWGTALCILVMVSGCLKSLDAPSNANNKAFISLLHLAPTGPTLEVYLNSNKASQPIVPGAISSAYSAVTPGNFAIAFKKANSDSVVASLPASSYDSMQYYTLLIYNDQPTTVNVLRIHDDFTAITTSNAYCRFFHVSPNVKVDADRSYADNVTSSFFDDFEPFSPGNHLFQVKKAGTDSLIIQTNTTLVERNAYTIILKGLAAGNAPGATGNLDLVVLQASN